MSAFDEILCSDIGVRERTLDGSNNLLEDSDLFPEFSQLLQVNESTADDDDSQGCPLPGTPEDESIIDAKVS